MSVVFFLLVTLWIGWLAADGLLTGSVWARGGAKDRFTRPLDMKSFAHKVNREDDPVKFWIYICFYLAAVVFFVVVLLTDR
ncbi:MAG: hypothetical protein KTR32_02265 [Granulosicoccus sp.]|nr:hypothetical protein [Granulosicoccus sp.]